MNTQNQKNSSQQASKAVQGMGDDVSSFNGHLQDMGHTAKKVAQESLEHVRDNVNEYYQKGVEKTKQLEHQLEGKIQEYPMRSLLIASGVGLVVGMLLRGKSSRG